MITTSHISQAHNLNGHLALSLTLCAGARPPTSPFNITTSGLTAANAGEIGAGGIRKGAVGGVRVSWQAAELHEWPQASFVPQ